MLKLKENIVIYILKAAFIPIIVPFSLIFLLFYWFGVKTETVLVVVIIAQLYIVILQTDIFLRQHLVLELQHQPLFEIRNLGMHYGIRNVGNHPAYNVILGFTEIVNNEEKRLSNNLIINDFFPCLKPGPAGKAVGVGPGGPEEIPIEHERILHSEPLAKHKVIVRISYNDVLGEQRETIFVKPSNINEFLFSGISIESKKGILLPYIERLSLVRTYFKIKSFLKR